jgi:hypothetical protein
MGVLHLARGAMYWSAKPAGVSIHGQDAVSSQRLRAFSCTSPRTTHTFHFAPPAGGGRHGRHTGTVTRVLRTCPMHSFAALVPTLPAQLDGSGMRLTPAEVGL